MQTKQQAEAGPAFLQTVSAAISQLKQQLQKDYEQTYPGLGEIVRLVLDQEETNAYALSLFPHLFLPDLVEAHIARLDLQPAETRHNDLLAPHRFFEMPAYQPAPALCG